MADAFRRSGRSSRLQVEALPPYAVKRPRANLDMPSGLHLSSYHARDIELPGHHGARDTDFVYASYERYLLMYQLISTYGGETGRSIGLMDFKRKMILGLPGGSDPAVAASSQIMGVEGALGEQT